MCGTNISLHYELHAVPNSTPAADVVVVALHVHGCDSVLYPYLQRKEYLGHSKFSFPSNAQPFLSPLPAFCIVSLGVYYIPSNIYNYLLYAASPDEGEAKCT